MAQTNIKNLDYININKGKMMDLISSCCGIRKRVDIFEQARLECTAPSWEVPPSQALSRIMFMLAGGNPDYDNEIAFNTILAHLQQDQLRKNVTFVLKNLIILDLAVQQRLFLSRVSRYYNSQLIYMQGQNNSNQSITTIKDLIASYYIYIKQKAKYYEIQSAQLLSQTQRQKFMEKSNSITILNEINVCFKIQNLILDVNTKFKNGDKTRDLICFIYSLLLKTYLFCHSIVSIALKTFVGRIPLLSHYDLEYIRKFANYFSKDYSKNFAYFISSNQNIPSFEQIKYKEMIFTSEKMLEIIEAQLKVIQEDPGICPEIIDLSPQQLKALSSQPKSNQKLEQSTNLTDELQKRKQFVLTQQQMQNSEAFKDYVNGYSDMYSEEPEDEGENIQQFMDPFQIFTYYGVYRQQNNQGQPIQVNEDIPEQQEQIFQTTNLDQQPQPLLTFGQE